MWKQWSLCTGLTHPLSQTYSVAKLMLRVDLKSSGSDIAEAGWTTASIQKSLSLLTWSNVFYLDYGCFLKKMN